MLLTITHRTHYRYDRPVAYGLQQLRLTPKTGPGQRVVEWSLEVEGGKVEAEFDDEHNNRVTLISFSGAGHEITATSRGRVETEDLNGVRGRQRGFMPLWFYLRPTELTRPGARVCALIKGLAGDEPDELQRMHALSERIRDAVAWATGHTDPDSSAEHALETGRGVCQDHAHVFCAAARMMGTPARYVSGHLLMEDRTVQEAGHAWAEAHIPNLGWVGFDISNAISPDARYVRFACGPDYASCAPVRGLRFGDGSAESLAVDVEVAQ